MGCGYSNKQNLNIHVDEHDDKPKNDISSQELTHDELRKGGYNNTYHFFTYRSNLAIDDPNNRNILLYTLLYNPKGSTFVFFSKERIEKKEIMLFGCTESKLAVSYNRGNKLNDFFNKDKFFVLIDGDYQVYCLIDGHGPFGDIIGQIVQDKTFIQLTKSYSKDFSNEYESIFVNLFEDIQQSLINQNIKLQDEYDPFLSGASVSIVVIRNSVIYTANVGNVLAMVVSTDQTTISKIEIDILTIDDSDFYNDNYDKEGKISNEDFDVINIHGTFDMRDEIRRIYENGGEIRQIGEEEKGRIFAKGKYYPGLINTRGLGDQIGGIIGVINKPHISKMKMKNDSNYYLVMYTDGIGNCNDCMTIGNAILGFENRILFY